MISDGCGRQAAAGAVSEKCSFCWHTQLLQFGGDFFRMPGHIHLFLNVADNTVFADVNGVAGGKLAIGMEDPHRSRHGFIRIAEDGIIRVQTLGESGVLFHRVTACGEVGNVKLLDELTAVTQRFALLHSALGKRQGIPGNHDGLPALELSERIFFTV